MTSRPTCDFQISLTINSESTWPGLKENIQEHLKANNVIPPRQHGFPAGRSSSIQLLGQAKLIHCLLSRIIENHMWAGGHFSHFIA